MTKNKRTRESKRALRLAALNLVYIMDMHEVQSGLVAMQELTGEVYSILVYKDGGALAKAEMKAEKKKVTLKNTY